MNNLTFAVRTATLSVQANMLRLFGVRRASVEDFRCAIFLATRYETRVTEPVLREYELFAQFIEQKNLLLSEIEVFGLDFENHIVFVRRLTTPLGKLFSETENEALTQVRKNQMSDLRKLALYSQDSFINKVKGVYYYLKNINKNAGLGISKYIVEHYGKFAVEFHKASNSSLSSVSMFYGKAPGIWRIVFFDSISN